MEVYRDRIRIGERIIWRVGATILGVRWKIGLPNAEVDMGLEGQGFQVWGAGVQ